MESFLKIFLSISMCTIMMMGCAEKSTYAWLDNNRLDKIHKITIVTRLIDDKIRIKDRTTDVWTEGHIGKYFGAIGSLLEGAVLYAKAQEEIKASLGGDPSVLPHSSEKFSLEGSMDNFLLTHLNKKYEVTLIDEKKNGDFESRKNSLDYLLSLSKKAKADTLISIQYYYGIAGYSDEKSSAIIDAKMFVYNVEDGDLLLSRRLGSDAFFYKGRTIEEFAADNCRLLIKDLYNAADAISVLVGNEFGVAHGVRNFD